MHANVPVVWRSHMCKLPANFRQLFMHNFSEVEAAFVAACVHACCQLRTDIQVTAGAECIVCWVDLRWMNVFFCVNACASTYKRLIRMLGQVEFEVVLLENATATFIVEVMPKWAPRGADRFRLLVENGYYNGCRFFRVLPGFMAQWGIS